MRGNAFQTKALRGHKPAQFQELKKISRVGFSPEGKGSEMEGQEAQGCGADNDADADEVSGVPGGRALWAKVPKLCN